MTERELNKNPLSLKAEKQLKDKDYHGLAIEAYLTEEIQQALSNNPGKWWKYVGQQALNLLEQLQISRRYSPEQRYKFLTENADLEDQAEMKEPDLETMLDNLRSWFSLEPEFPELL